jgi:hypothetical protein
MQELRVNAKCAAAETTALVAAARKAATSLPDDSPEAANLLAAAKAAADAIAHIMKPLTEAQKSPDNPAAQQALLEAAKKVAPVAYKLVALSKSTAPHVQNKQHKQDLTNAANLAGEAVKALAASASGATSAVGEAEFDTALESVQAMVVCIRYYTVELGDDYCDHCYSRLNIITIRPIWRVLLCLPRKGSMKPSLVRVPKRRQWNS